MPPDPGARGRESGRGSEAAETAPEAGDLPDLPRPRAQTRLVGHGAARAAFREALRAGRLHHAWLIGGPRGIGKATLAYRIAARLAADPRLLPAGLDLDADLPADHPVARQVAALSHPNLVALRRVQAPGAKTLPTRISVEAARRVHDLFGATAGGEAGYRVCLIDSAEDLNANSANALLKMLEEPPPRALFLIVSHAPGRLLPTIRSRCRSLTLRALGPGEVAAVVAGFPAPFVQPDAEALARAAGLCEGSVARAVALLDPKVAGVTAEVGRLLDGLSDPDWARILKLAETLAAREGQGLFETALDAVGARLAELIDRRQGEGAARLLPLVEAADRIAAAVREAAAYNLDRRPLVLAAFADLGEAMRAG